MFNCAWANCQLCTLNNRILLRNPRMFPTVGSRVSDETAAPSTSIYLLGEAPGEEEDGRGKQFVGSAGQVIRDAIPQWADDLIIWDNAVRCRPTEINDRGRTVNRTPTDSELKTCSSYTAGFISRANPVAIMTLGATPLHYFWPDGRVTDLRGLWFAGNINGRAVPVYCSWHPSFALRSGPESPELTVFKTDIKRFFEDIKQDRIPKFELAQPPYDSGIEIFYYSSPAELENKLAATFNATEDLFVDLETTGLKPYGVPNSSAINEFSTRVFSIAISSGEKTIAFPVEPIREYEVMRIVANLFLKGRLFGAHNAQFELTWFEARAPGSLRILRQNYIDTMLLVRVRQARNELMGLGNSTRAYLGIDIKELSKIDTRRIAEFPLPQVLRYNGIDAKFTAYLSRSFERDFFTDRQLNEIAELHKVTPLLVEMELAGLSLDLPAAKSLEEENDKQIKNLEFLATVLPEVRQYETSSNKRFALTANRAVGTVLTNYGIVLPKTKSMQLDTSREVLEQFDNPFAKLVLEHRRLNKLGSTYIKPILNGDGPRLDGLLHPSYSCVLTDTGRLSSNGPNIQNFPKRRDVNVRRVIVAPPGKLFLAWDYRQLEARVIGMKTRDPVLCQEIRNKSDIHGKWTRRVVDRYPDYIIHALETAKSPSKSEEADFAIARDLCKNEMVFALFYGSDYKACSARMEVPESVTEQVVDEFWNDYKVAKQSLEADLKCYAETGFVNCLTHRERGGVLNDNQKANCVDFQTEALTQRGWVDGHSVVAGDVLLTLNPKTNNFEWQTASDVRKFPDYEGPVCYLEGKSIFVKTTPEHRWPVVGDFNGSIYERTSITLPNWGFIPRFRPFLAPASSPYSDDWIRLVGWVLTDGGYQTCLGYGGGKGYGGSQVCIYQSKKENFAELDRLFADLAIPVRSQKRNLDDDSHTWNFSGVPGQWFRSVFPDRILRPEFLVQLSLPQLNILLDTMVKGDGWIDSGRFNFCAGEKRKTQIDAFQMLSILCGRPVTVHYRDFSRYEPKKYESMTNIPKTTGGWEANETVRQHFDLHFIERSIKHEKLGMWCPIVPNTFFVARRVSSDGNSTNMFITGNTPIQGTAADLVRAAMIRLYELSIERDDPELMPRINVHDDLVFVVSEDRIDQVADVIAPEMVKPSYPFVIIPLAVTASVGVNWAEMEKLGEIEGKAWGE